MRGKEMRRQVVSRIVNLLSNREIDISGWDVASVREHGDSSDIVFTFRQPIQLLTDDDFRQHRMLTKVAVTVALSEESTGGAAVESGPEPSSKPTGWVFPSNPNNWRITTEVNRENMTFHTAVTHTACDTEVVWFDSPGIQYVELSHVWSAMIGHIEHGGCPLRSES